MSGSYKGTESQGGLNSRPGQPHGRLASWPRGSPVSCCLSLSGAPVLQTMSWAGGGEGSVCSCLVSARCQQPPAAVTAQTVFKLASPLGAGSPTSGCDSGHRKQVPQRGGHTHWVYQSQGPDPGPVTGTSRAVWPQRSAALLSVRRAPGGRRAAGRRPLSPDAASLGGVAPVLGGRGEAWARAPEWLLTQAAWSWLNLCTEQRLTSRGWAKVGSRSRPSPQQPAVSACIHVALPPSLIPVRSWPLLPRVLG